MSCASYNPDTKHQFRQPCKTDFLLCWILLPGWQETVFPQPQETEIQGHKLL